MADDTAIVRTDEDNAAALISSTDPTEFIQIECKLEPDTGLTNSTEDLSAFVDESSALHIPVSLPTIKHPVVLLERCDKIWETLKLIKTQPIEENTNCEEALTDDCNKNEDKMKEKQTQYSNEVKQSTSYVRSQPKLKSETIAPFKFSVQRTKKLYPCVTCGKQYLERRSLRKHSERVHGVIMPLLKRKRKRNALKKNFNEANPVASTSNENKNSEKFHNNRDLLEETKIRLTEIAVSPPNTLKLVNCNLCQGKVLSLRKHLINYHKIGGSSSMMDQLESSLLSETTSPPDEKTINKLHEDGFRIMDNENDIHRTSQVKRKYTSSYANTRKKFKRNNERYALVQNPPTVAQRQIFKARSYKCDICLGIYSSSHSLYKHKRIHTLRGETRDNFHKFKCRYFNSPFNKKYKLLQSSVKSANNIVRNTGKRINQKGSMQLRKNSKRNTLVNENSQTSQNSRAARYIERTNKINKTICICGRLFRNPHTLFIHKKNCELCQITDNTTQSSRVSSDRDSGIGINITIKKRNDSYEIVGKDDEDNPVKSETYFKENILAMSHTSNTKDSTKASTKQKASTKLDASKYSINHSILKLQDTDEDVIIDIEDDTQNENNTTKQKIMKKDDKRDLLMVQNYAKDGKTEKVFDKVSTLKQMCQEVLDVLEMRKSGNIENKNKKYSQIKDQETCKENRQVKNQEIHQEYKRELRSTNKRYRYSEAELDHFYDETKVCMAQFDPLMCAYCEERYNTIKTYDNHQCTVKEGRSFDEFSLHLRCFCCKEVLNSYTEFDRHVRIKHYDRAYHCYQCPERFTSDKARLNHFHSEHNDLICRFCNKKISISVKVLHEGYHLGFGYPCHKCKKAYINSKNLSYHKYTIHANGADNLTTCSVCLKLVKFKTIRRHMATHKHNSCYFCGKMFTDRVGLEYHTMLQHGTNSKLKCNLCGTRFYTKKQLEKHEKVDGCNNGEQKKLQ
ncbi:zinc finger protein 91 [Monomorium pharaonis]|uniref:zinc finger protein 91 n=1 Tax=Monomorium pharaonis TaxID=307658 RepID=UPI00063F1D5E|nr:zinc finger protein 91 [Monomorium pharaonis]